MAFFLNCCLAITLYVTAVVQGQTQPSVQGSINSPIYSETTADMTCNYDYDATDIGKELELGRGTDTVYGLYLMEDNVADNDFVPIPNPVGIRMEMIGTNRMDMTLISPGCADEGQYFCRYKYRVGLATKSVDDTVNLALRVRPKAPILTWITPSSPVTSLEEGATISVRCQAETGKQGEGTIVWRISRNGEVTTELNASDPEVTSDAPQPLPTQSCIESRSSTLTLTALSKSDQNLQLMCFVKNTEFNPTIPTSCVDSDTLCRQTDKIQILSLGMNCTGQMDGNYEIGCRSYVICSGGKSTQMACDAGTAYNKNTGSCDDVTKIPPPCGVMMDCTLKADGGYADSGCASYYTCVGGVFVGHNFCPAKLSCLTRAREFVNGLRTSRNPVAPHRNITSVNLVETSLL